MEEKKLIKAMNRIGDQFLYGTNKNIYNTFHDIKDGENIISSDEKFINMKRNNIANMFSQRVDFLEYNLRRDIFQFLNGDPKFYSDFVERLYIPYHYADLQALMDENYSLTDDIMKMGGIIYNCYVKYIAREDFNKTLNMEEKISFIMDYCGYILSLIIYEAYTVYIPQGVINDKDSANILKSLDNMAYQISNILLSFHKNVFDKIDEIEEEKSEINIKSFLDIDQELDSILKALIR